MSNDDVNPFSPQNAAQYDTNQPAPSKKSPWLWVVLAVLIVGVGSLVCCGGLAMLGFRSAVSGLTAPVNAAVDAMNADPAVAAKLGTPITSESSFGVNEYSNQNGVGSASVSFRAQGPNGSADVTGKMKLFNGVWSPDGLTITCEDDTEIQLP